MSTTHRQAGTRGTEAKPFSFWDRVKEIDMFFQGNDPVHQTMRRMAEKLEGAGIPYALMGAMALNAHRYRRTTDDVDFLLNAEGLTEFRRRWVGTDYEPVPGRARRFIDRVNGVTIDILVTGRFPGRGQPGPVAFPEPNDVFQTIDGIRVVDLATLVGLKLAARRHKDFGDVVDLIRIHDLDESFADKVHPTLRGDYVECLEEKRREDEYEARED
jgi:hypothetical protein